MQLSREILHYLLCSGSKRRMAMNEIFKILEEDARKTPQQIATMTGIPLSKVKAAIKQAERDRTIL
ncbi:MAG: winged helix-turn-helix domain-containing protein, partial [Dehalococcoidia bacterium]|nr:winged helix-turn-helix domain-containing protein [Dehalococcoidia bacterium]